jgi:hypothetical protein
VDMVMTGTQGPTPVEPLLEDDLEPALPYHPSRSHARSGIGRCGGPRNRQRNRGGRCGGP